jgi:hypothetical protein
MSAGDYEVSQGALFDARRLFSEDQVGGARGYARGPERSLLSALLFDAVQGYVNYTCSDRAGVRNRYREAYEWVQRRGSDYVFAFDSVCEALGIDPNFLRCGLANVSTTCGGPEVKKTRKNF